MPLKNQFAHIGQALGAFTPGITYNGSISTTPPAFLGSGRSLGHPSNNFLIFIGIILLLALAGIITPAVIKKIRNKNK